MFAHRGMGRAALPRLLPEMPLKLPPAMARHG